MVKLNGVNLSSLSKINSLEISQENLAVGSILFYDGTGINSAGTRTEEIGQRGGDTISLAGWWVANGQSSTPDFRNHFIRSENTSSNVASGTDDAINVSHTHTLPSVVNHSHGLNNKTHTHTLPSSGYVWSEGYNKTHNAAGNFPIINNWYSDSAGNHTHTIGSTDSNHSHSISGGASGGVSGIGKNIPLYYTVIMIIKRS